jgi:hypothetical protein
MAKTTITLDENELRTLRNLVQIFWLDCEDSHDQFLKNNDDMPHGKWTEQNYDLMKRKTDAWNIKETLEKAITRAITK